MTQSSRLSPYVTGDFSRSLTSGRPEGGQREAKDVACTGVMDSCCPLDQEQMGGWRTSNLKRKKIAADGWAVQLGMCEVIGHRNIVIWRPQHFDLIITNDVIKFIVPGESTPSFKKAFLYLWTSFMVSVHARMVCITSDYISLPSFPYH